MNDVIGLICDAYSQRIYSAVWIFLNDSFGSFIEPSIHEMTFFFWKIQVIDKVCGIANLNLKKMSMQNYFSGVLIAVICLVDVSRCDKLRKWFKWFCS